VQFKINRLARFAAFDALNAILNSALFLRLKVHKREKFFGSDFEFFTIL
jgi:hypothetical protein